MLERNQHPQDIFVSTNKEGDLFYQFDELETLGGKVKQVPRLSGEMTLQWCENRVEDVLDPNQYISLKSRTSTLSDII